MMDILRGIVKFANRGMLLAILIAVISILAMLGFRPPSFSFCLWDCGTGELTQTEVECLAGAMLVDSAGEEAQRSEAQDAIAKAVRKYALTYERDICITYEQGLTMIPMGYVRRGIYAGRDNTYVFREFGREEWERMVVRATAVAKIAKGNLGEATHYIRSPRKQDRGFIRRQLQWIANMFAIDLEAERQIRSTMELVPNPSGAAYRLELYKAKPK